MRDLTDKYEEDLNAINQIDCDTNAIFEKLGRKHALTVVSMQIMNSLGLDRVQQIDHLKMSMFVDKISRGYLQEVQYHNDIHAADVLQMAYIMLV